MLGSWRLVVIAVRALVDELLGNVERGRTQRFTRIDERLDNAIDSKPAQLIGPMTSRYQAQRWPRDKHDWRDMPPLQRAPMRAKILHPDGGPRDERLLDHLTLASFGRGHYRCQYRRVGRLKGIPLLQAT